MKQRRSPHIGYVDAVARLFKRIEALLGDVPANRLPLRIYVAGGAAAFFHTGIRVSRDIDAALSLRVHLPESLVETYTDTDGKPAAVYFDANYNDTLGPLHGNAFDDARALPMPGLDRAKLDVRVLTPIDLTITKLGRFAEHDREDIEALARAGLLDADAFERRAKEALDYYVGHPAAPRANLREAMKIVRACSKTPKSSRGTRRGAS